MDEQFGLTAEISKMVQRQRMAEAIRERTARQAMIVSTSRWQFLQRADISGAIERLLARQRDVVALPRVADIIKVSAS